MSDADFWVGPSSAPETYRLVSLLGGGGEGEVWRAELPLSEGGRRQVAVKILPGSGDPEEPARWDRFGHLLKSLGHPGLVRVTDVFVGTGPHRTGEPAPDPAPRRYVVMDHVEGPTLREWCDEHPDATAAARLRMLRTVAAAVDEMHAGTTTEVPVAHGDIKPANVIVRPDGATVLVDLGLARLADSPGVVGHSAPYTAPELRVAGALATPETDRYAFAATTAEVLTGQLPPTGPDGWLDPDALERRLRSNPVTQRRPALIAQILAAVTAPPEGRPPRLRPWLDAARDAISEVATTETVLPPSAAATEIADVPWPGPVYAAAGPPVPPPVLPQVLPLPQAPPADPPARRRRRWWFWLVIPVVVVVLAAATFAGLKLSGALATEVQAEPIQTAGANPFMPSVGTDQPNVTAPAPVAQQTAVTRPAVTGNAQGLYGGTLDNASCDQQAMIAFLQSHPAEGAAWAAVEDISPADIPSFVSGLTPVILRADTAVTNHGFSNGQATTLHSVLQAGTAVLVDDHGVPRARCLCGNPLTPPDRFSDEKYAGPRWPSFAPQQIVVVQPAPVAVTVFVLVDPATNIVINRPVGTHGDHDQPSAADLAKSDLAGTYTVTHTVTSCTFTTCGVALAPIQIDCTGAACSLHGPNGPAHPLTRNGGTLTTSGYDGTTATCNGQSIPDTMITLSLTIDSSTVTNGHLKARALHGTFTVAAPAELGCTANTASFALNLAAA